jgi:hypothetical protein
VLSAQTWEKNVIDSGFYSIFYCGGHSNLMRLQRFAAPQSVGGLEKFIGPFNTFTHPASYHHAVLKNRPINLANGDKGGERSSRAFAFC